MDIQQDNGKQGVRTRHIDIRLTEKEYEMIVEKAAECGMTLSNYGRKLPKITIRTSDFQTRKYKD